MSDEKKTDTEEWQIDSLDEEDDIIELTEEIEPPPPPRAPQQDQLDEIVVGLDDSDMPAADEQLHESTEAALEEAGFDDPVSLDETDGDMIDLGDETISVPEVEMNAPVGAAADGVEFEAFKSLEGEAEEALGSMTPEPFGDSEEPPPDIGDDAMAALESEIQGLSPTDPEDVETIEEVIDLEDDPLPEVMDTTADKTDEVSLEELLSEGDGDTIGIHDSETEVDIDEVADLEPIVPEMEPLLENDADAARQEELTAGLDSPVPPPVDDIIEISEFDQQYFDDAPPNGEAGGLPSTDEAEQDDFLELIDVEEADDDSADLDDEIIHFDQNTVGSSGTELDDILLDPDHTEPELELPEDLDETPSPDLTSRLMAEAAAPDLAGGIEDSTETNAPPVFIEPSSESEAGIGVDADGQSPVEDELDIGSVDIPAAMSAAQIEAAVANIIERDYAGQIETMVATAIEKVVRLEIERIKARLFEDDPE